MERNPNDNKATESSLFAVPLVMLTRLCIRNPVTVVVIAVLLAVGSVYVTKERLGFKMSRLDLINPKSGFNRLWLDYLKEFDESGEIIVVVEGNGNAEVIPILEHLSKRIASFPDLFRSVLNGVDISKIQKKGLHYVPNQELAMIEKFAAESQPIIADWNRLRVDAMLGGIITRLQSPVALQDLPGTLRALTELDQLSSSLSKAFTATPTYGSPWPTVQPTMQGYSQMPDIVAACSNQDTYYFLFPTKTDVMGFVLLKLPPVDTTKLTHGDESIEKLRAIVAETREIFPESKIGLTGMPILENDEMRLSSEAMSKATILSLIGVAAIFITGFGGLRHPLLAVLVLIFAFVWTMGYITLVIGHLNILSVSFGAMLIGLGTDFSVHYLSRYLKLRRANHSTEEALCETARCVGPGIVTGTLTTSIAFYVAAFVEFTGIAELGIISGGGILLCALGTLLLFPAMIQLLDRNQTLKDATWIPEPLDIRAVIHPTIKFPFMTFALVIVVAGFLLTGIPRLWYDYNLLNLQPLGLESVELEQRLLEMDVDKGGKNVWFALSIADSRDELLKRKEEFKRKYPELVVEEIVSWFPQPDNEKLRIISALAKNLETLPERPTEMGQVDPDTIGAMLARLQILLASEQFPLRILAAQKDLIPAQDPRAEILSALPDMASIQRRLSEIRESIRRMTGQEFATRIASYQAMIAGDLLTRLKTLQEMAILEPPSIDDLPESLVNRFVGKGGKHLMRIYTTANIWNMDEMKQFVTAVRDIDPKATGSPLQTYEASLQMHNCFSMAAVYALMVIFFLLLIDFCNLKDTIVAMLPMFLGFAMTFGILGWLDVPLNPANMIVLPLILGIGIDDGVHILHDFRARKGPYRLSSSTATSVLITTLTTIVGFGSMMIASHRGLQSLGRVLVIGITCCMLTSLFLLPALLTFLTRSEKEIDSAKEPFKSDSTLDLNDEESGVLVPTLFVGHEIDISSSSVITSPQKAKRLRKRIDA